MARHPLAKARDEYLESERGRAGCDLASLLSNERADDLYARQHYLRNRIESAFIAGWNAAEYHALTKPHKEEE
jgi:hypothetical protein